MVHGEREQDKTGGARILGEEKEVRLKGVVFEAVARMKEKGPLGPLAYCKLVAGLFGYKRSNQNRTVFEHLFEVASGRQVIRLACL